jgi:hypothetical protein
MSPRNNLWFALVVRSVSEDYAQKLYMCMSSVALCLGERTIGMDVRSSNTSCSLLVCMLSKADFATQQWTHKAHSKYPCACAIRVYHPHSTLLIGARECEA